MHGDDEQVVPIGASAMLSHTLLENGRLEVHPGFAHGMCSMHHDVINADLLAFFKE